MRWWLFHGEIMTNAFSPDYVPSVGLAVQKLAAKKDNAMGKKKGTTPTFWGLSAKADERIFEQRAQRAKETK